MAFAETLAGNLRPLIRNALVCAGAILLVPLWVPAVAERRWGTGGWFAGCAELLSLAPGKPGIFLRRSFYRMTLDHCDTDIHVGFGSVFAYANAEIHSGVYVGLRCTIGKAVLERDATIGSNVDILSGRRQHSFKDQNVPIQNQGGVFTQVRIGGNSWVGNSTVIMADIGADSVIGAGSVVVKPVPPGAVAVGNPATVIKTRAA